MASDSEERSYSSPPKRIKLDESSLIISRTSAEIDSVPFSPPNNVLDLPSESGSKLDSCENIAMFSRNEEEKPFPDLILSDSQSKNNGLEIEDGDIDEDDDGDDNDEVSSTVSNLSELSGLSNISGQDWKGITGPMNWVQKQMDNGVNPRILLSHLMGDKFTSDDYLINLDDVSLWKIIVQLLSEPPRRIKLRHINTLDDVIHLLKNCSRIIVLTGAGVSVSCGIPDFRSRDGIYSRLAVDFPDLPDPQAMFDINYFRQDPRPFFKFAREIYPGQFKPSPCHRFIKILEENNKLLRNYTQNIDTLEQVAGIKNVVECHGSFATASCTKCGHKVTSDDIREEVFQQKIPMCPKCSSNTVYTGTGSQGVMKPDIVFFGEGLPESFHKAMAEDKEECDLLIVIGSSLKVRPVALIPSSLPSHVPQVLINRERLPYLNFDVELLGDGDIIIDQLCKMMGDNWTKVCWRSTIQTETSYLLPSPCRSGYNTECSEGEGEMSVDWSRDSDNRQQTDSNMEAEEIVEEKEQFLLEDSCGECRKTAPSASVKCRKIRRLKERSKSPVRQGELEEATQPELFVPAETADVRMSIEQEDSEDHACLVSRRHLSMDSTRDSGIGDGSNSSLSAERHMSVDSHSDTMTNLASRLPENTYYFIRPNRYIFQGAEVMDDSDDSSNSSDSDSEIQRLEIERTELGTTRETEVKEVTPRSWTPSLSQQSS